MQSISGKSIIVLGAGMVGVSAALELQARGAQTTLIDRRAPGQETSYGNAGVIARSSLMPMNNPGLWANLPKLLTNRTATLRYSVPFLMKNVGWAVGFLSRARKSVFEETAAALDSLIRLSTDAHMELVKAAGAQDRLNDKGWIFLYRSDAGFKGAEFAQKAFDHFDVNTETLDRSGLQDLEPGLKPIFERALWIKDCCSVNSPGEVVSAYARLFTERGGTFETSEIQGLSSEDRRWKVRTNGGSKHVDAVVVALGPWSRAFLERVGMKVPMGFERGYHMHYSGANDTSNAQLNRPIYDTAGSYVLSPMEQGLRLTTGVELTSCDAPENHVQLTLAEASAREAIDLGERVGDNPWLGRRPTMPDSRPVIGEAPGRPGMFLAFGHQHIGFSTGPGTARVLADLMEGKTPEIPPEPFSPSRFVR